MRSRSQFLQQARCGFSRHVREQNYFASSTLDETAFILVYRFECVVATLHVNIGTSHLQKGHGIAFPKYEHTIDAFERGDDQCPIGFRVYRAARAF